MYHTDVLYVKILCFIFHIYFIFIFHIHISYSYLFHISVGFELFNTETVVPSLLMIDTVAQSERNSHPRSLGPSPSL